MTREEAVKAIKSHCYFANLVPVGKEALDIAIKALEQEPCEDAISREDAMFMILHYGNEIRHEVMDDIKASMIKLPSVNPKQKTGKWIEIAKYSDGMHKIACSECKNHIFDRGHANSISVKNKYKFCPICGSEMEGKQE